MEIVRQTPANPRQPEVYIFRNGKRYVKPYNFEFISHVKSRWEGKTIVDLFAWEFKGRPYEYYVEAVESGRILVDGKKVDAGYVVRNSQKISHFVHRHEPPVLAGAVLVLHSDPDVITVLKPASVPVHPCGQYRKNTVVEILQAEQDLEPLFPVHRLDRLVSGLLIFARNAVKAECFREQIVGGHLSAADWAFISPYMQIMSGLLQKEYIAKVIGVFPEGEQMVDANVIHDPREGRSSVEVCDSTEKALKGKVACTRFIRISTDGIHSIVLCKPVTGRTHQIRVHLRHTGHPIANDMLYLPEIVVSRSTQGTGADRAATQGTNKLPFDFNDDIHTEVNLMDLDEEFSFDPMCTNCPNLAPKGYDGSEEGLWLHCLRYSGPDWSYDCPYPEWALLS